MSTAASVTPTREYIILAYYHFLPNKAAAIAAMCLFAVVSLGLLATTVRSRAWWMTVALVTGAMEVGGYALRLQMLDKPEFNTYVVSYAFLVIGPVFLVIVEYICVGKLIAQSEATKGTPFAKVVSWFMSVSEVTCLGLQCASGGLLTQKDEAIREKGRQMMLAGLCLQIGFFTIFTGITLYVHLSSKFGYRGNSKYEHLFISLYSTIVLIYVRNIFRVVEFAEGFYGYLATHESFFYGFDFAIIYLIMLFYTVFNYGFYVGVSDSDRLPQTAIIVAQSDPKQVANKGDGEQKDLVVVECGDHMHSS